MARNIEIKATVPDLAPVQSKAVLLGGRTRVHLDQVEHRGSFVEIEVVMAPDELVEDGVREARELLQALGIPHDALVAGAYINLQEAKPA